MKNFRVYLVSLPVFALVWWTTGTLWLGAVLSLAAAFLLGLVRGLILVGRGHVEG